MARVRKIVTYVVLAGVVGAAAFFGGKAYKARADDRAGLAAVDAQKPESLLQIRAADEASLHGGPVPIEEAMRTFATKGRLGMGPRLKPKPSQDQAPLMGWSNTPKDVPDGVMTPPAELDAGRD